MIPAASGTFEQRFLHAAAQMLAHRLEVMGGSVKEFRSMFRHKDEALSLMGMTDWEHAMRSNCAEEKAAR